MVSAVWILILCCNILSIGACAWLIYKLRRLAQPLRKRLFARQLISLAVADLLFHIVDTVATYEIFGPLPSGAWFETDVCMVIFTIFTSVRLVSLLQEMIMALSFLLLAFRWKRTWRQLIIGHLLWGSWVVGIVVGIPAQLLFTKWIWNKENEHCEPLQKDWTSLAAIALSGVLCLGAYVAVMLHSVSLHAPGSVQRIYYRRASFYPLNFMITYLPVLILYMNPSLMHGHDWRWSIAATLESLNGAFNVATYAWQSHYANTIATCSARASVRPKNGRTQSWNVGFGPCEIIEIPSLLMDVADDGSFVDEECGC